MMSDSSMREEFVPPELKMQCFLNVNNDIDDKIFLTFDYSLIAEHHQTQVILKPPEIPTSREQPKPEVELSASQIIDE